MTFELFFLNSAFYKIELTPLLDKSKKFLTMNWPLLLALGTKQTFATWMLSVDQDLLYAILQIINYRKLVHLLPPHVMTFDSSRRHNMAKLPFSHLIHPVLDHAPHRLVRRTLRLPRDGLPPVALPLTAPLQPGVTASMPLYGKPHMDAETFLPLLDTEFLHVTKSSCIAAATHVFLFSLPRSKDHTVPIQTAANRPLFAAFPLKVPILQFLRVELHHLPWLPSLHRPVPHV